MTVLTNLIGGLVFGSFLAVILSAPLFVCVGLSDSLFQSRGSKLLAIISIMIAACGFVFGNLIAWGIVE